MMRAPKKTDWRAYGLYLLAALAVMLPLFQAGFILTLDMVFTPELRMPGTVTASWPLHAALHILNILLPADILTKLLLLATLLLASIGMHRLIGLLNPKRQAGEWGVYIASIFFAINPYTYSRFMAGQYSVLLGYALLPWFVRLLISFGRTPNVRSALQLGALTTLIGVVSIHTLGEVLVIAAVAAAIAGWRYRQNLHSYLRYGAIAAAICLVLSSYWLVPLALGHGATAETIHGFTAADTQAFATNGGSVIGKLGNVVRLQGFWADDRGLYLLPQDRTAAWGLMMLIVLGLVAAGAATLLRGRRSAAVLFIAAGVLGIMLALGFLGPVLGHAGYREPHKFIGLLALGYAVSLAFGINALLKKMRGMNIAVYTTTVVIVIAVPLLVTRVMFWGFDGQLVPRQYPASWSTVNIRLNQDTGDFSVLALPWHQYMSYQFAGRIIANPSASFFDHNVIVSQNPELGGASGGTQDARHQAIEHLLQTDKSSEDFSRQLADNDVKYILLAKEVDYSQYDFLQRHPELHRVADYPEIALYENTAWRNK